jgi:uncharacterized protein (DUF2141 family)
MIARPRPRRLLWLTAAALAPVAVLAQQRDARVTPAGTGEISGVVWSADATPQPVRRVVVSISAAELPAARSVITDDTGRFAFTRLPAGAYAITARKAAHLPTEHGSARPGRPGSRVALAAGERRAIALTMFRGATIAGTLRDGAGQPVAGVPVAALNVRGRTPDGRIPAPETTTTDDLGQYRLYGLAPGDYAIAASPTPGGAGEIGERSSAGMDALLAALAQRHPAAVPAPGSPAIAQLPEPRSVGYAPVYFPGTAAFTDATRLRLGPGEAREGLHFVVAHVPVASITGIVGGDVMNLTTVQLAIIPDTPRIASVMGTGGITSTPPDTNGEFTYGNLAPGRYRIVARARRSGTVDPNAPPPGAATTGGMRGGGPPPGTVVRPAGELLYGVADVEVRGQDVTGVAVQLRSGGTLAGRVVFDRESAPVPDDVTVFRAGVSLVGGSGISIQGSTRVGTALSSLPPVNLEDDGTFLVTGIGVGTYLATVQVPADLADVWKLRSAIVEGRDLLDTRIDGPDVNLTGVVLTLSDKRTEISGTLQSASGQPVSDYFVVAFSTDRANWRPGARRFGSARPATDGRFVFADLPAGEYFIAALTDMDGAEWQDPAYLEQVAPAAVKVTVGEGEKKVQDLRIK